MGGLACYWAREAVLNKKDYDLLFEGAAKRGSDSVGVTIIHKDQGVEVTRFTKGYHERSDNDWQNIKDELLFWVTFRMRVGDILLAYFGSTSELDKPITEKTMQPLLTPDSDFNVEYVIANCGGVAESFRKELKCSNTFSEVDSEMIIRGYEDCGCNMQAAMEKIPGSFAFAFIDMKKDKLFAVTAFNPLAQMYVKGYGYFLHSSLSTLSIERQWLTGSGIDGSNVHEGWSSSYIDGFTILEIDLQTGSKFTKRFEPRYLHPTWDYTSKDDTKSKVIIAASGGVDSMLTAWILAHLGHKLELMFFNYGQKAVLAERWAVSKMTERLACDMMEIDLTGFYGSKKMKAGCMLTDDSMTVNEDDNDMKSVFEWVAGRNAVFATMLMASAEQAILTGECDYVCISAGWNQMSEEEGGWPDNSFMFNRSLERLKDFGYIAGKRINFLPVLQRLTKTEEWYLGAALNFPFELTVSCDNPKMFGDSKENEYPRLCTECGSTKLSIIAADRAGVEDKRKFLGVGRPKMGEPVQGLNVHRIIDRLVILESQKESLHLEIEKI